jgi:hypothetical protein
VPGGLSAFRILTPTAHVGFPWANRKLRERCRNRDPEIGMFGAHGPFMFDAPEYRSPKAPSVTIRSDRTAS